MNSENLEFINVKIFGFLSMKGYNRHKALSGRLTCWILSLYKACYRSPVLGDLGEMLNE